MSNSSAECAKQSKLRGDAEALLKEGSAPSTNGWLTGVGALSLLHKLARDPGSADHALKLLHELQVHQVELDLQHEHLENTQRELSADLARYRAFFEFAPIAYIHLSPDGNILEGNLAAANLFGAAYDELSERRIDAFLTPESRMTLNAMLERLRSGGATDACDVQSSSGNSSRALQLTASLAPDAQSFLTVLVDTTSPKVA